MMCGCMAVDIGDGRNSSDYWNSVVFRVETEERVIE